MQTEALEPALGTPRFDPDVHKSPREDGPTSGEDSFVKSIITGSPQKSCTHNTWMDIKWDAPPESNSRVSPSDLAQIKDPLDAIDALEEALEEIGEALPTAQYHGLDSPQREGTPVETSRSQNGETNHMVSNYSRKETTSLAISEGLSCMDGAPKDAGENAKPKTPRQAPSRAPEPTCKTRTLSNSKPSKTSSNCTGPKVADRSVGEALAAGQLGHTPANVPKTSKTEQPKANRLSIASLSTSKPGFTPVKSTKPLTKPTFELPGEAISRRMKAQREQRLKKEEEELQRRRAFKASKIRYSIVPSTEVRETITSRSRANLSAAENSHKAPAQARTRLNFSNSAQTSPTDRTSLKHTGSDERLGRRTSFASPRTRHSSVNSDLISRSSSLKAASNLAGTNGPQTRNSMTFTKTPATKTDHIIQKSRGKEIFGQDRQLVQERERERKEREDAAKRARAEAAQRGRQASREWAERQKQKSKIVRASLNA
ncbi:uncharacterized protein CIMG_07210 [Coccidioides immitis RS]|uniref:Carboxylesterase family protein n=2 Tax=Coccidioides immitis TaxID=5501 RepID=A0A0E1RWE9_COCIM|nr:uncharacterized protein CIMG_07210 [Coccidioides immitis RS]EAS31731.2 hypothetical protein CIMG_07210 [Coccidioides immitis RS]KMP04393.1 hypothetical protein CIRG_04084 [Coccidioides immitis RMSCC 2394]TPX24469.1 hypothetical protein DIZ76_013816 [Coccidioides immitis]